MVATELKMPDVKSTCDARRETRGNRANHVQSSMPSSQAVSARATKLGSKTACYTR